MCPWTTQITFRSPVPLGGDLNNLLTIPAAVDALSAEIRELRAEVTTIRRSLPPTLLTVAETAKRLDLSESSIRRRIRDGSLRVVRVGGAVRVDLSSIAVTVDDDQVARLADYARRGGSGRR